MRFLLAAAAPVAALAMSAPALAQEAAEYPAGEAALAAAIANPNRDADRARDEFRHPAETIAFFQVAPDMKVGEYAPGGGWYSRVLGNYLGDRGKLVGLYFTPESGPFDAQ